MINHHLNLLRVENPVHPPLHEIVDRNRGGDFMTHDHIYIKHHIIVRGNIPSVGRKNLLSDGFTHCLFSSE